LHLLGRPPRWAGILLRRPLPDPLPPAKRLDPRFARALRRIAARKQVDWELVLAVLRARGRDGPVPASSAVLRALARQLAALGAARDRRRAVMRLSGGTAFAPGRTPLGLSSGTAFVERVIALADYDAAVGLHGLVRGLDAVKPELADRVLGSGALEIYPAGRADVRAGRVDVRVLVLMLYMAERYRPVVVTSLVSGHGFLTKSGNVSAHAYGRAVDIAAVGGTSVVGHQQPGGPVERALQAILALPRELAPRQLISLFDLGGASFALPDHADHIHVGY
jgi:hypothetical protein